MAPISPSVHAMSREDHEGEKDSSMTNNQWSQASSSFAPWYKVPQTSIVSIEHPFIIKSTEKGLASLGGPRRLEELIKGSENATARLYMRPGDRMSRPLKSANVPTKNVLLKITVPKRTGLKRRKGLDGPFHEGLEDSIYADSERQKPKQKSMIKDTQYLIRTMRDNPTSYQVQAAGTIGRTHRFRGMPDFVVSTASMPFMKKMQEHIMPFEYDKLKTFTLDMSKGPRHNTEIIPPPNMTHFAHPFNYCYRQNPAIKQIRDPVGNVSLVNVSGPPKIIAQYIPYDAPTPDGPSPEIAPIESMDPGLQRLIAVASDLLKERPIFTRRALINCLPGNDWETIGQNSARNIFQYCGYTFASGPWRDALIRFGVDPRKDPSCRVYQTMMFMVNFQPRIGAKWVPYLPDRPKTEQILRKESHLFDGRTVSTDGKIWQPCDITDPLLKDILATSNIRKDCHIEADGWYQNGTWAKVRMIMKAKITAILADDPQSHAVAWLKIAHELPDVVKSGARVLSWLGKDTTSEEIRLATAIRTQALTRPVNGAEAAGPSQDDEFDEVDEDGEIAMPNRSEDECHDPRLTEAMSEIDRLGGGTAQLEDMVDSMDVDDSQDLLVQETLDQQLA